MRLASEGKTVREISDKIGMAMSISGHHTVSMFMRYNITSDADKVEALKKTAEHFAAQPRKSEEADKVVEMPERSAAAGSK